MAAIEFLKDKTKSEKKAKKPIKKEIVWSKQEDNVAWGSETPKADLSLKDKAEVFYNKFASKFLKKNIKEASNSGGKEDGTKKGAQTSAPKEEVPALHKKEEKWDMSNILDTNLIKSEVVLEFSWKKNFAQIIIIILTAILLLAAIYQGLLFWEKKVDAIDGELVRRTEIIDNKIKDKEDEMQVVYKFQKKLESIKGLLDNHVYWTNFFNFLEENTSENIFYSDFSGDTIGEYSFNATSKSIEDVTKLLSVLDNNENVRKVEVNSLSVNFSEETNEERISFNIKLSINPKIFLK